MKKYLFLPFVLSAFLIAQIDDPRDNTPSDEQQNPIAKNYDRWQGSMPATPILITRHRPLKYSEAKKHKPKEENLKMVPVVLVEQQELNELEIKNIRPGRVMYRGIYARRK